MLIRNWGTAILILFFTLLAGAQSEQASHLSNSSAEAAIEKIIAMLPPVKSDRLDQTFTVPSSGANKPKQIENDPGKKGCVGNCAYSLAQRGGSYGLGVFYYFKYTDPKIIVHNTLHNFAGGTSDGEFPNGNLVKDGSGHFYGTTSYGGSGGCGTVFKTFSNGAESVAYSFLGSPDGCNPEAGLITDAAGNLFGTTSNGGTGYGTVFELSPSQNGGWTETVIYSFCSQPNCSDGEDPVASLALDNNGNLFGTTVLGGSSVTNGIIFELSPNGNGGYTETVLYNFLGGSTGGQPRTAVTLSSGSLYGTTESGGFVACNSGNGCGLVYQLSPGQGGWTYSVIHTFTRFDGAAPNGNLIVDTTGNLFGTTAQGGIPGICEAILDTFGCGTVFEISAKGAFSTLYRFAGGTDGASPEASLSIDGSGDLYGTTFYGGAGGCADQGGCGTVFALTPQGGGVWTEVILLVFNNTNGAAPTSGVQLSN